MESVITRGLYLLLISLSATVKAVQQCYWVWQLPSSSEWCWLGACAGAPRPNHSSQSSLSWAEVAEHIGYFITFLQCCVQEQRAVFFFQTCFPVGFSWHSSGLCHLSAGPISLTWNTALRQTWCFQPWVITRACLNGQTALHVHTSKDYISYYITLRTYAILMIKMFFWFTVFKIQSFLLKMWMKCEFSGKWVLCLYCSTELTLSARSPCSDIKG